MIDTCRYLVHRFYCLVLLSIALGAATSAPGGEAGARHGFSDAFFEVFLDGKRTPEHVILTVRVGNTGPAMVEAHAMFFVEDPRREATRVAVRTYSTRDTSITGATVAGDTLRFELLLDGRDADRKMRIRSIRDSLGTTYRVKASGLWSDQTHTAFIRAEWRPVEIIELRYPRLVSPAVF